MKNPGDKRREEMTTRRINREMAQIVELHKKGLVSRGLVTRYYEMLRAMRRGS
jgi:hypothetical protein